MTSKQRAYLKSLAMTMDPILQLGKSGLTPENTASVEEALAARDQDQRSSELSGRSERDGCRTGRKNTFSGGTGNRKKNCLIPRR